MTTLDINKNGYIDYTEFLAGCMKSKIYLKDEHLRRAFEYFDKDKSGTISVDELQSVLSGDTMKIPTSDIKNLMKEVDLDKDNQINYNEFLEMMKKDLSI